MGLEAALGLGLLLVLLALGVPIYVALIGSAIVLLLHEGATIGGIGQEVLDHMNSATLLAVNLLERKQKQGGKHT